MKKQLTIMVTCVLFLTLYLSGCEQFFNKPDHVEVNVMVAVLINVVDENYNPVNISLDGAKVKIEVSHSVKGSLYFERYILNGLCRASCNFTLTQGESIECIVTVPNGYDNFQPITNGSATLTWETAQANMGITGLYNWYPHITIIMKQGSVK
jgi:hypothetical protein